MCKVEEPLHPSEHGGSAVPPVDRKNKDVNSSRTANEESIPPPLPILSGKLEEDESDGSKCSDDEKEDKDDGEDAPEFIHGVTPDGIKQVVQLEVDGSERQKSSNKHLNGQAVVETLRFRDGTQKVFGSNRRSKRGRSGSALTGDTSKKRQGQANEQPDRKHSENGVNVKRRDQIADKRYNVEKQHDGTEWQCKQARSEHDIP